MANAGADTSGAARGVIHIDRQFLLGLRFLLPH